MKDAAVFTMSHDEAVFLPIWLRYMTSQFDPADVYVIDHRSTDGSVDRAVEEFGVGRFDVPTGNIGDYKWVADCVVARFGLLLEAGYRYVLYLDTDEFAVADPDRYDGLGDFVRRCERPVERLEGWDVFQMRDEPPLDLSRPILSQRRYWRTAWNYSKPVLSTAVLDWCIGQHDIKKNRRGESHRAHECLEPPEPNPDLKLLHFAHVDHDIIWNQRWTRNIPRSEEAFENWFWDSHGPWGDRGDVEEIPERFRSLV